MNPLAELGNNVKVCVSIWWENLDFCVTIEHHYNYNHFFGEVFAPYSREEKALFDDQK